MMKRSAVAISSGRPASTVRSTGFLPQLAFECFRREMDSCCSLPSTKTFEGRNDRTEPCRPPGLSFPRRRESQVAGATPHTRHQDSQPVIPAGLPACSRQGACPRVYSSEGRPPRYVAQGLGQLQGAESLLHNLLLSRPPSPSPGGSRSPFAKYHLFGNIPSRTHYGSYTLWIPSESKAPPKSKSTAFVISNPLTIIHPSCYAVGKGPVRTQSLRYNKRGRHR